MPKQGGPGRGFPVVVFLHGGWWSSAFDLTHSSFFCSALRDRGVAVCGVEYRRVGSTGGGWPNTFLDAARSLEFVSGIAPQMRFDTARILLAGHSAGAHLAFWLLGRQHVVAGSPVGGSLARVSPVGGLSLAGAVDLGLVLQGAQGSFANDRRFVERLMGGTPEEVPDRYLAGDPGHLLPLNVPQRLLQGGDDDQIPPEVPQRWAEKARRVGDAVTITMLAGAGHLDLIDTEEKACQVSITAALQMLGS